MVKKVVWTREHPDPPPKGYPSDWYWFWKDDENQVLVFEVYAERKWFAPGWWGPKIEPPKGKRPQ